MIKRPMALLLLLFIPLELPAQRYGRPDSAQNYGRVQDPHLLLQVKVLKKRFYFRSSDLKKKPRVHVTLTDPKTRTSHTYEGVNLESLLPPGVVLSESDIVEVSFASHQTMVVPSADLNAETKPMVVDTVDGKTLRGYVPYYFIAKTQQENASPMKDVGLITVKWTP